MTRVPFESSFRKLSSDDCAVLMSPESSAEPIFDSRLVKELASLVELVLELAADDESVEMPSRLVRLL